MFVACARLLPRSATAAASTLVPSSFRTLRGSPHPHYGSAGPSPLIMNARRCVLRTAIGASSLKGTESTSPLSGADDDAMQRQAMAALRRAYHGVQSGLANRQQCGASASHRVAHHGGGGGVAVRDLAARMPEEVLEFVGEAHGGLANFCRHVSETGRSVQLDVRGGVAYVRLAEDSQDEAKPPVGGKGKTVADPQLHGLRRRVQVTLTAVFSSSPISAAALQSKWGLETVAEVSVRVRALATTLHRWLEVETRRPGTVAFPVVDGATGQIGTDCRQRVDAAWRSLGEAGDGAGSVVDTPAHPPDDALLVLCFNGDELAFAHAPRHERQAGPATESDELPQPFDLYRMAAFLSVGRPTGVDRLAGQVVPVTVHHPLLIALTFPDRVRIHVGSVADSWSLWSGPDDALVPCEGLSYLLQGSEVDLLKPNPRFAHMTDEEVEAEREKMLGASEKRQLRASKVRRRFVRELFRRHFPQGNPFLHGEVVAQYLYDRMEPHRWYGNSALKDELPGGGKDTMGVGVHFFDGFPDLFIVRHVRGTLSEIMRRESDMLAVHGDEALREQQKLPWTADELRLCLIGECFTRCSSTSAKSTVNMSLVWSQLPHYHRKAIRQQGGLSAFTEALSREYPNLMGCTGEEWWFDPVVATATANSLAEAIEKAKRNDSPSSRD